MLFILSSAVSSHASLPKFESIDDAQEWAVKNARPLIQDIQEKLEHSAHSVKLWYTGSKESDYINGKEAGHPDPSSVIRLILDLEDSKYEVSTSSISEQDGSKLMALFDVYNHEDNALEVLTVLMPKHLYNM